MYSINELPTKTLSLWLLSFPLATIHPSSSFLFSGRVAFHLDLCERHWIVGVWWGCKWQRLVVFIDHDKDNNIRRRRRTHRHAYLPLAVSLSTALLCQSCHFTATMVTVDVIPLFERRLYSRIFQVSTTCYLKLKCLQLTPQKSSQQFQFIRNISKLMAIFAPLFNHI